MPQPELRDFRTSCQCTRLNDIGWPACSLQPYYRASKSYHVDLFQLSWCLYTSNSTLTDVIMQFGLRTQPLRRLALNQLTGGIAQGVHYQGQLIPHLAAMDPATKLPNELIHRAAELLTLKQRFKIALVSHTWREVLFAAPLLWSTISICPSTIGNLRFVAEVLDACLRRSQGVDVTVRLFLRATPTPGSEDAPGRDFGPRGPFARAIPRLLSREIHRVRVLELVINHWDGTGWEYLFQRPAPVLERFYLNVSSGQEDVALPNRLFGNVAPRLREVYLRTVTLPVNTVPALAGVTSLFYDWAGACDGEVLNKICAMRNLRYLTLPVTDESWDLRGSSAPQQPAWPRLRRLQLWNSRSTHEILQFFPPPEHLCFSASLTHDLRSPFGPPSTDGSLLISAILAKGVARVVTVGFRASRLSYFDPDPIENAILAVRLDGRDVVVDLLPAELSELLSGLHIQSLCAGLQQLAIPAALFSTFDFSGLPELHELALYVAPNEDFPPLDSIIKTPFTHRVLSLRIVQVIAPQSVSAWDMHERHYTEEDCKALPATTIVGFVQRKLVPSVLRQLILDGYSVTPAGYQQLRGVVPQVETQVTGGWLPDDDCALWPWHFPEETSFRT
ncbi:hypothetical protein AURDEDRAFT_130716 [Auricularia subglabra TFB-10046 SS5]|uniref:F-box domain-containing protein n=1 Tax=Auricularia subglabra (strain TFB-10046 / SS5) TaxID=717982 RepID=J0WRE0_AURST|nr:hypothetical protein AURDEDRAFT_130716 [Auricularia subglabra TFB-10046 SS5]